MLTILDIIGISIGFLIALGILYAMFGTAYDDFSLFIECLAKVHAGERETRLRNRKED